MSSRSPVAAAGVVVVAAVLLAGAARVQAVREQDYSLASGRPGSADESLYLRSGTAIRRMAGPLGTLAADVYWIRTIQHYGGTKRRLNERVRGPEPPPALAAAGTDEYALLYPLLDITTTLDPRFKIAYRFGAVFSPSPIRTAPAGPTSRRRCLKRGSRLNPISGSTFRTSGSSTTGTATTTRPRPTGSPAPAKCPARRCG